MPRKRHTHNHSALNDPLVKAYKRASGTKKSMAAAKRRILAQPIKAIDVAASDSIVDFMDAFKSMSIQARRIGQCIDVYENMLRDPRRPTILLGLAGPLIAGGLRKVIRDMIAYGIVDAVVSTGAILYQDLFQAHGFRHYKGTPDADDAYLRSLLINRIYDTYVDDEQFVAMDVWIGNFARRLERRAYSSREFLYELGRTIRDNASILGTAARYQVPVFAPALNDSSIGIGLTNYYHAMKTERALGRMSLDPIRDNYELTQLVVQSRATAAIYVAGGVPKNYINDSVVMGYIFGHVTGGHAYAFQVTTDVPHWGGLSGSTLDEAKSWGKVNPHARRAMAFVEPTVSLPLIVGSVIHKKLWRHRRRLALTWNGDNLVGCVPGEMVHEKQK